MALFGAEEEKLKSRITALEAELRSTSAGRDEAVTALRAATNQIETRQIAQFAASPVTRFVQVVGLGMLSISVALMVSLVKGLEVKAPREVIWGLYLLSQFGGLYLIGYGKDVTSSTWTLCGLYMTTIFSLLGGTIVLILTAKISLLISSEIVALTCINSVGVVILVLVERKVMKRRSKNVGA